jgi:hypothetical protein
MLLRCLCRWIPANDTEPQSRFGSEGAATTAAYRLDRVTVLDWLLDSDPAICWQVFRDLVDAPAEVVAKERARVAAEG